MMPGTSARHRRDVLNLAAQVKKKRDVLIELNQQTESLTKKDIATWRQAWQAAINYEQPNRCALLDVYNDALVDLHLSGCIAQRKGKTLQKPFVLTGKNGKEDDKARLMFEREWFNDFLDLALDSPYFGHSLIQFGDITNENGVMSFTGVELVPRKHVVPEYGVITREAGDDWKNGISYREGDIAVWCIEVGKARDLGVLLKCAPQSLSKKNMLAYWDTFGEVFGMPIRIGKTMSQDTKDIARIETMLAEMGAASWGVVPGGHRDRNQGDQPGRRIQRVRQTDRPMQLRNFQRHTRADYDDRQRQLFVAVGNAPRGVREHLPCGRHDDKVPRERPTYPADDPARVPARGGDVRLERGDELHPGRAARDRTPAPAGVRHRPELFCRQVQNPDHRG